MNRPWRSAEMATAVTDSQPTRFPCVGLYRNTVFEHKVDTRDELLQRIFDAAGRVNDAAVRPKVTLWLIERVRICI